MSPSPGVPIDETPGRIPPISGVSGSIALVAGWTARGPLDRAVHLASIADVERDWPGPW